MKLKTVRVRRSRPSVLSLSLALMITMFFVYLVSLSPGSGDAADTASAAAQSTADVRMEGMRITFECEGRYDALLEARVRAALCAESGGAGLILAEENQYAVVQRALPAEESGENTLSRSADGLTLRLSGPSNEIAAVSDAAAFLRAQASETGGLASALEGGDTDAASIVSLLNIYRTQGQKALSALREIENPDEITSRFISATESALARLDDAISHPDAGRIKLIHAAACAEWISMLEDFAANAK